MTSPLDPPLVRERAAIRAVRSRGVFQLVFGVGLAAFAVFAGVNDTGVFTVAIASIAGALLVVSGVVAVAISRRRLTGFEREHGAGAGLPALRAAPE